MAMFNDTRVNNATIFLGSASLTTLFFLSAIKLWDSIYVPFTIKFCGTKVKEATYIGVGYTINVGYVNGPSHNYLDCRFCSSILASIRWSCLFLEIFQVPRLPELLVGNLVS